MHDQSVTFSAFIELRTHAHRIMLKSNYLEEN